MSAAKKLVALRSSDRIVFQLPDEGWFLEDTEQGLSLCTGDFDDQGGAADISGEIPVRRSAVTTTRLVVIARTVTADGTSGLLLEVGPRDKPRRIGVPASFSFLPGNAALAALADLGVRVDPKYRRYLERYLALACPETTVTAYTMRGWQSRADGRLVFVLGENTIVGDESGVFQPKTTGGAAIDSHGSLHDWMVGVAEGACRLLWWRWCLMAAFAAPLLRIFDSTGFAFHAVGQSSQGKTLGLRLASTVWGRGAGAATGGYMLNWNATGNGIEAAAEAHNDLPLLLDEISQADPSAVRGVVYSLAGGEGRTRMRSDTRPQDRKSWRTVSLSTGEISLEAKLAEARERLAAGMSIRILELPVDDTGMVEPVPIDALRTMEDAMAETFGTAGPRFLRRLIGLGVDNPASPTVEELKRLAKEIELDLLSSARDARHRRAARSFAVVAAAGEMAVRFEVLPDTAQPRETARAIFELWRTKGGGANDTDDYRKAAARLLQFVEENRGGSIQGDRTRVEEAPRGGRLGWERNGGQIFLLDKPLEVALRGVPTRSFLQAAEIANAFRRGDGHHLKSRLRVGEDNVRAYRFLLDGLRSWVEPE